MNLLAIRYIEIMYGKPRGPPRPRAPPVKEAEELDVYIEAVGDKGDGIAKKDGFILFVKGTTQGETCRVRITKVLQKVGFAEKIGPAQAEPAKPKARPKQIVPDLEPEVSYEDTEDFGSDLKSDEDDLSVPDEAEKDDSSDKEESPEKEDSQEKPDEAESKTDDSSEEDSEKEPESVDKEE